jgi:hypothetical protein
VHPLEHIWSNGIGLIDGNAIQRFHQAPFEALDFVAHIGQGHIEEEVGHIAQFDFALAGAHAF